MRKLLLSTIAFAALAIAPAYAQSTTGTMLSGTGVTCAPSTAASTTGTSTDTTASTSGTTTGTGTSSSTMALSANNQIDATVARTALTNAQTNVDKLSSLSAPSTTVCLVDLDALAQSDETLKGDISKFETNNAQIKSALEANTALMSNIKTNHPTFDVSKVRGVDIGPNNELVLYVISGT